MIPDDYSRHEALHMCSVITNLLNAELANNPYIKSREYHRITVNNCITKLADLYQLIGEEHFNDVKIGEPE